MQKQQHDEQEMIADEMAYIDSSTEESKNYLTFLVASDIYGIDIIRIKEILEITSITQVPMTPDYISGVINLRGNVMPVIDLANRLGKASSDITKKSCILIVEVALDESVMDIGMTVDAVNKVLAIPDTDLEPPPAFGVNIRSDFIKHMGRLDQNFIIIFDIDKLLDVNELAMFDNASSKSLATTTDQSDKNKTMATEQY